jgi:hypothetical protein
MPEAFNNYMQIFFPIHRLSPKQLLSILFIVFSLTTMAQEWKGPVDSTSDILLKNRYVELQATAAMYDMYNFDFDKAERQYRYLKRQYGWHPLPYFLLGLNYWWRMLPYVNDDRWDAKFLAYMDTAQVLAHKLYKDANKIEGAFFLSATYAFQGRLYSDRQQWTKASFAGKNALKYLEECKGQEEFSPELLFGDALFNYYAEWVPENYPFLKPIMVFFPKGNKELGIEQLKTNARNAFYTRTEAQYFLMRILHDENNDLRGAMQVAQYLRDMYPNNAYFHRYYVRLLYHMGRYKEVMIDGQLILDRLNAGMPGYEYNSGRYAAFFMGHIHEMRYEYEEAKQLFTLALEYGKKADATEMGYYIYSLLHLGRIAMIEKDKTKAEYYFKEVRSITKNSHAANKEAKEKLSELKKI